MKKLLAFIMIIFFHSNFSIASDTYTFHATGPMDFNVNLKSTYEEVDVNQTWCQRPCIPQDYCPMFQTEISYRCSVRPPNSTSTRLCYRQCLPQDHCPGGLTQVSYDCSSSSNSENNICYRPCSGYSCPASGVESYSCASESYPSYQTNFSDTRVIITSPDSDLPINTDIELRLSSLFSAYSEGSSNFYLHGSGDKKLLSIRAYPLKEFKEAFQPRDLKVNEGVLSFHLKGKHALGVKVTIDVYEKLTRRGGTIFLSEGLGSESVDLYKVTYNLKKGKRYRISVKATPNQTIEDLGNLIRLNGNLNEGLSEELSIKF